MFYLLSKNFLLILIGISLPFISAAQGTNWEIYTNAYSFINNRFLPDAKIPGYEVSGFGITSKGETVLGVRGAGIYKIMANSNKYQKVSPPRDIKLYNTNITALVVDQQDQIWVGTSKGLVMFDGVKWTEFEKNTTNGFPFKSISELYVGPDGKIYATGFANNMGLKGIKVNGAGLAIYENGNWLEYSTIMGNMPLDFVSDLTAAPNGTIWMNAGREDKGVMKFDGQTFELLTKQGNGLPTNSVTDIAIGKDGTVYLGTQKGVFQSEANSWKEVSVTEQTGFEGLDKLNARFQPDVRALGIDANGTIWVGTFENGLIRIQDGKLRRINVQNSPITSNYIREVIPFPSGKTYFLTGRRPENVMDAAFNETASGGFNGMFSYQSSNTVGAAGWETYHQENTIMESDRFSEMAVGPNNDLWLVNGTSGLTHYDGQKWNYHKTETKGLLGGLYALAVANDGTIYAGSQNNGMQVYKNGQFSTLNKKNSNVGDVVIQLATGPNQEVWFASFKGAAKMTGKTVETFDKKSADFPSNAVKDIAVGADGTAWVALQKGVGRYQNGSWTFWNKKNSGLPANIVDKITVDSKGQAWAISHRGVSVFEGSDWKTFPDIMGTEFGFTCAAAGSEGKMYVGTASHGLYVYQNGMWSQYNVDNSPLYLPRINALTVASDGTVWINNTIKEPLPGSSSTAGTPPGTAAPAPTPEETLRAKILAFDPEGTVVRWKP